MNHTYSSWLPRWMRHGLGMLALLTTIGTAHAQPSTPVAAPTVTTDGVTNIGAGSATVLGTLTSAGSTALTDYGVVYVQGTGTPTTSDTKVQAGTSSPAFLPSSFSATVRVAPATTYTARAYATNSGGTSYGNAVIIGPVVSRLLSIERLNSSPTNASIVTYALTFSIPVEGLTLGNFALATTGSVAGASLQSLRSLSSNATYSATYGLAVNTGTGDGTLALYLANYMGTRPGIESPVPTPGSPTYVLDKTPPTATISTTATNPTSSAPIPFTVTFSESVTGFTANGIAVTNGTITSALTNAGNAYSFTVTPAAYGLVTVNVPANGAYDAAFNRNTAASPFSITYVESVTATTWTGAVSSDWFTAGNWTAGVPTTSISATIPIAASGRYPLIAAGSAAATVLHLTIDNGATLNQSDNTLDVRGDLTTNGTFLPTGGTVVMGTRPERYGPNILGTSRVRFWNLTVDSYSVLLHTLAGTSVRRVLTLHGPLVTLGYPFILESDATGTALVVNNAADPNIYLYGEGAVFGATTVQRYIDPNLNPGPGYRHFSSPVANTTVADFTTPGFTPVLNSTYNGGPTPNGVRPFPTVFSYDQTFVDRTNASPNFDKGFFSPSSLSAPLEPGRGYDVQISATELVDFVGTLNNGDISVSLARNAAGTLNAADAGWQFMGNPYPAPLDYSRVELVDRAGLEAAIYVYSSTSPYGGQYRAYVNRIGNPILPVGQGFFARVATPGTTGTFVFRNSQRLTTLNATAFQRTSADLRPVVQLELRSRVGATDTFSAYAETGATPTADAQYDAVKLPNPTGLNLASLASNGAHLAIDGRSAFTDTTVLPLVVGVPAAGTYTLMAAALDNLPTGLPVYMRDTQT
ncbi:MAG: hypothetical protein EOO63_04970, partial [Hymenobacter sp.]